MRDPNIVAAQGAAFRILNKIGMPHPNQIELEDLAMFCGPLVVERPMKGAEGRLIRDGAKGIIRIRAGIKQEGRKRFCIGHELGHWELHQNASQFICSRKDMMDYARSPVEVEANTFAAELLMPTKYFRPCCQKVEPSFAHISTLAEDFRTTLTATSIRFAAESKLPLLVVLSEDGIVKWCYADTKAKTKLPYVKKGMAVPRYSSAGLMSTEGEIDQMEEFDSADWFPQLNYTEHFGVLEQSKKMGNYPFVLTLLWLTGL